MLTTSLSLVHTAHRFFRLSDSLNDRFGFVQLSENVSKLRVTVMVTATTSFLEVEDDGVRTSAWSHVVCGGHAEGLDLSYSFATHHISMF